MVRSRSVYIFYLCIFCNGCARIGIGLKTANNIITKYTSLCDDDIKLIAYIIIYITAHACIYYIYAALARFPSLTFDLIKMYN